MNISIKGKKMKNTQQVNSKNTTRKRKPSLLDPFLEDIKYYVELGVTVPNITKIVNVKTPVKLSSTAYRHFIETRL